MDKTFKTDYAKYYDFFNCKKDYSKEVDFLEKVIEKYGRNPIKSILNLGCGTGRHDEHLSHRGYNITGLDLSEEMINIALSRNIPAVDFVVGDMTSFNLEKKYDIAISMFAAFGYLNENIQIENSLRSINRHLNPQGLLVIEVWNGLGVMKELPSSRIKEFSKEEIKIKRQSFPKLDSLNQKVEIKFQIEISKKEKIIDKYEENHSMRFFFPQEVKYLLNKNGFEMLNLCDTFDLEKKVSENCWNMVVIAKKMTDF
ncbi:methyltransferase domain-containing protein [Candidatus Pacearchaeota archaeon]|nr:methyltransferase domain-containing protein [Candidatus Pacearchaeota archaeon]